MTNQGQTNKHDGGLLMFYWLVTDDTGKKDTMHNGKQQRGYRVWTERQKEMSNWSFALGLTLLLHLTRLNHSALVMSGCTVLDQILRYSSPVYVRGIVLLPNCTECNVLISF